MRKISELTSGERTRLQQRVLNLYDSADEEIQSHKPVCVASGKCCRFAEYGHTLFLSNLEAVVLLQHAPAYSTPTDSSFCPFQVEKLCTAREYRPLGCRVYFCDPGYAGKAEPITEHFLTQLKLIAEEEHVQWQYAPLHRFLDARSPDLT